MHRRYSQRRDNETVNMFTGFTDWWVDVMQTPWCRAGPYLIGMAMGVLLFEQRSRLIKLNLVSFNEFKPAYEVFLM